MAGPVPAWSWGQRDLEALASHPHPPPHVQPQSSLMREEAMLKTVLGTSREAGPALCCPTRNSVSKRPRGAECSRATLGRVPAGGFAQHSSALPPAWGSERGPRGLGPPGSGVWAYGTAVPGGSPWCPSGLPGQGVEDSTTLPTPLHSLIYTQRPCTHPSGGDARPGRPQVGV